MKDAKSILLKVTHDCYDDPKVTWGRREGIYIQCLPRAVEKILKSPGTYRLTLGNRGCELAVEATGGTYYPIRLAHHQIRFCPAFARFLGFKVKTSSSDGGWIVTPDTLTVRIKIERVK
jgi:hypothetical protein